MKLYKRSDIPRYYKEYPPKYDEISHRMENTKYSHYLINDSVNINCYWKSREQMKKHPDREWSSENIIRFELQAKYRRMSYLRQRIKKDVPDTELCNFLITSRLLGDEMVRTELKNYFSRVIKPGDYYTLKGAKKLINNHKNLYADTKEKLIQVLELIDEHETIPNAREQFVPAILRESSRKRLKDEFNARLRRLADLGINPVTIPERWRIPFIPSLLTVYGL
jgi:hypothetical protein